MIVKLFPLLLVASLSYLLFLCSIANGLDAKVESILDKLYSKESSIAKLDHKKTLKLLKEVEPLLQSAIAETSDFETRKNLERIPKLIKYAEPKLENCNRDYLASYSWTLEDIDHDRWRKTWGRVSKKSSFFSRFSTSSGPRTSNAYRFVEHYQAKQYQLCSDDLGRKMNEKVKTLDRSDASFLMNLGFGYKRWKGLKDDTSRVGLVALACQEALESRSSRSKKTWKNRQDLLDNSRLYEEYFNRIIYSKCRKLNEKIGPEYAYYTELRNYLIPDRLTKLWLRVTKVCSVIEKNKDRILNSCLNNEMYEPNEHQFERTKIDSNQEAPQRANWLHATENARNA